jgi:hypothetical protein
MTETLRCYRCGASLEALSLPLARLDECPSCTMQVHVCRMCVFFDPHVARQCREDDADEVKEKERANFCDYFKPSPDAHEPRFASAESKAKDQLAGLFGDGQSDAAEDAELSEADKLFSKD